MSAFNPAGTSQAAELIFPIMGGPAIPFSLIAPYEAQAKKNHYQTLKRLAERGGLSICEAMAVMSEVAYERRPIAKPTVEDWLDFVSVRKARVELRRAAAGIDVEALTYRVANAKLGEGDSVRCEGPTDFEKDQARAWVKRVLAAIVNPAGVRP